MRLSTVHLLTVVWHTDLTVEYLLPGSFIRLYLRSKNSGRDVMLDAPSAIDQTQPDELNLIVDIKEGE